MTLAPLQLDDLTWDDMVAAIRRRIPAESQGNWTLHAPADPGITLLELFAFLTEQRLYWLDQVPDAFVVAVLRLLDLDAPRPAVPAATVLQIVADLDPPTVFTVPAGTGFTRDPRGEVVFTVDDGDDVTVLPVRSLAVYSEGRDRTADLAAGRAGRPAARRRRFRRGPDHPGSGHGRHGRVPEPAGRPGHPDRAPVPPAWSPDHAGDVPPPAALTWSYDDDHGGLDGIRRGRGHRTAPRGCGVPASSG